MSQGRILFADNNRDFLETRTEFLKDQGYEVFSAQSVEDAERILKDNWVHLALLDIRLENDDDERDVSGLTLAKNKAYRTTPKIMLTGFPTYRYVREALGPTPEGRSAAVDFLAKQDGPQAMLQAVKEAFSNYVRINQALTICWEKHLSFLFVANLIEPDKDNIFLLDHANELEDLFRRLFYDSHQITIDRLLAHHKDKVELSVFVFSGDEIENQFVVACGRKEIMRVEEDHYEKFVSKMTGHRGITRVKSEETIHFAATLYSLSDGSLDHIAPFTQFYRENSGETVLDALDHLLGSTLGPWQDKGRFLEDDKLPGEVFPARFGISEEALMGTELEAQIEAICRESLTMGILRLDYTPYELALHLANGAQVSGPNPASFLAQGRIAFQAPLLCGITHGHLRGSNILVDLQGRTWLFGFSNTGPAPFLCDFVSLEVGIKLETFNPADIWVRYALEQQLATVSRLDDRFEVEGHPPAAQKALRTIERIRQRAAALSGNDLKPYLAGLLYCTLAYLTSFDLTVRHTRRELLPYLHSLLSSLMICKQLSPAPPKDLPAQAINNLWIDEPNKEVWVEGKRINLSSQEYDLLLFLYRHANRLCSRTTIAEQVFAGDFKSDLSEVEKKSIEEGRINSTMSRMRRKLEPNPDHPKYIASIRGEGYKLLLPEA